MSVLTIACRIGNEHEQCAGHIYLGSIFGKPTDCECKCHIRSRAAAVRGEG